MQWYELNPERLQIEIALLRQYHQPLKLLKENKQWRVEKMIYTSRDKYLVRALFSDKHPYSPMKVMIVEPKLPSSVPHRFLYDGGSLCLFDSSEVGEQTTAKIYLDWTIQWIACYEKWLDTDIFPETNRNLRVKKERL